MMTQTSEKAYLVAELGLVLGIVPVELDDVHVPELGLQVDEQVMIREVLHVKLVIEVRNIGLCRVRSIRKHLLQTWVVGLRQTLVPLSGRALRKRSFGRSSSPTIIIRAGILGHQHHGKDEVENIAV